MTVTNCVLVSSASALKLGMESHGDFRHCIVPSPTGSSETKKRLSATGRMIIRPKTPVSSIVVCATGRQLIRNSRTGIALPAKDGGTMEDIRFANISMTTQLKWGKGLEWPIVVDIEKRTAESKLSHIRDVSFSDITVYTQGRVLVEGMSESPIEQLRFRNLLMRMDGYGTIRTDWRNRCEERMVDPRCKQRL